MKTMWMRHWGLRRDPFLDGEARWVPLDGHEEAVARLVHAIESSRGPAVLIAGAGLGKTMTLRRALAEGRSAGRFVAMATNPLDGPSLWSELADRLGAPRPLAAATDRATAWRAIERAAKVRALQGHRVVFAIDGAENLMDESSWRDVERLGLIDSGAESPPIVILTVRDGDAPAADALLPWTLAMSLAPLTREETARYLAEKLIDADGSERLFTPRAVARMHAMAAGVPRGLDRLASLSLMAAAARGLEVVSSAVVDDAAQECRVPWT